MRHIIIVTVILLCITWAASAQHVKANTLYWVVETNINNPSYSVVKFYDRDNFLMHEVRLHGVYIDIRMPKHKKKLDQLLKDYTERVVASSKRNKSKRSI
ncbi:MAG: hypothetical protein C0490_21505 [Marivirga sp.]|nr:hypothetical protein [Marivirga sp.]